MTQIVRLSSGDSIQVRTGVLRGAGPAGPVGPAVSLAIGEVTDGEFADAAINGSNGVYTLDLTLPWSAVPGPTGSINDYMTEVNATGSQPVTASTDSLVSFGSVDTDELDIVLNSTTFEPVSTDETENTYRVLSFTVAISFYNGAASVGSGLRSVIVKLGTGATIATQSCDANPTSGGYTVVTVPVIYRFTNGETFKVYARHGNTVSPINITGTLRAIRVGAGPEGQQGPEGQANTMTIGSVSTLATGAAATATITGTAPNQILSLGLPKGDQGDPGNADSGFQAIHELDGSGGNV